MYFEKEIIEKKKFLLLEKLLNSSTNKKLFDFLDALILEKCFDNAYEYSLNENIESIYKQNISSSYINCILETFFVEVENKIIYTTRSIYELAKISKLPSKKINKIISDETYLKIETYLRYVSHETNLISFDFLVLRITDNFLLKIKDKKNIKIEKSYLQLKKSILNKMLDYSYIHEKKEKETTFLCWIDRLLKALVDDEINAHQFICIIKKVLLITKPSFELYWKIINSLDYLLSLENFISADELKKLKKEIEKLIEKQYICYDISVKNLRNIFISILAKQQIIKEDYYYLFDTLSSVSRKSDKTKLYVLKLCEYMIYISAKKQIFHYRFIRKYFTDTVLSLFNLQDSIEAKDEELQLLVRLWYMDDFFCFEKNRLLFSFVSVLKSINSENTKLSHNNFYKYCDILDYIIATTPDLPKNNIVDFLAYNSANKSKLRKHFNLIFM